MYLYVCKIALIKLVDKSFVDCRKSTKTEIVFFCIAFITYTTHCT